MHPLTVRKWALAPLLLVAAVASLDQDAPVPKAGQSL